MTARREGMQMMLSLSAGFLDHQFRGSAAWEEEKDAVGGAGDISFVPKTPM